MSKGNDCRFPLKECIKDIKVLTLVGQNGVNVHPSAKLIEQGTKKVHLHLLICIICLYVIFYIFRKCKFLTLCGTKRIKQEAYCYAQGSNCEMLFKKRKKSNAALVL